MTHYSDEKAYLFNTSPSLSKEPHSSGAQCVCVRVSWLGAWGWQYSSNGWMTMAKAHI